MVRDARTNPVLQQMMSGNVQTPRLTMLNAPGSVSASFSQKSRLRGARQLTTQVTENEIPPCPLSTPRATV